MVIFFSSMFSGYFEFTIAFAFTFALAFGILTTSRVFAGQERTNLLMALAIALLASFYEPYVSFLFEWIFYLIWFFMFIFIIVILKNLFWEKNIGQNKQATIEILVAIAIMFLVFLAVYPQIPLPSGSYITSQDVLLTIGVAFVALILLIGSRIPEDKKNS